MTAERLPSKGFEVQSDDLGEIAEIAATDASRSAGRPLFVEDTGLFIASLNGFPGPYANYVYRRLGLYRVLEMLKASNNRKARFESVVVYNEPGGRSKKFRGSLLGQIARRPVGTHGFGFDPIFIPEGENSTLAQLTLARKCSLSHRAIAVRHFGEWYTESVLKQPL